MGKEKWPLVLFQTIQASESAPLLAKIYPDPTVFLEVTIGEK